MVLGVCCFHCLEDGGSGVLTAALVSVDGADKWVQDLVLYVHVDVVSKLCREKNKTKHTELRHCIGFGSEMTLLLTAL